MTDEQRVFVGLVEEILQATPGLRYQLHVQEVDTDDEAYAAFEIATNPDLDLTVAIELAPREFRLRVNGDAFPIPLEGKRRIERWIERRCRDVERLVKGDLRIETETLFGKYLSSGVYVGPHGEQTEIADRDEGWGWIGLLGWLLPFGLSPLRRRNDVYRDWFDQGG
ncbi:MAG: hypothetical protein ACYS0D_09390 [Planctomycetota bacterium]|jgi:hypothetical protein